ncbi:MAG: hypothetical protein NZ480_04640 [Bdellovibrionaceae bacterium]|nr:hypothetical protein [Pseudobdellovibrionaceae bacterium]MDW8190832.1 hypothetical protein [Pseudobdellovibrionaceae bacterium]
MITGIKSRKSEGIRSKLTLGIAVILLGWNVIVQADRPSSTSSTHIISQKHWIPNAFHLYITPNGISFFNEVLEKQVNKIANNLKKSAQGTDFVWTAPSAIHLNHLNLPDLVKNLIETIHQSLSQWLLQFPKLELRPNVTLSGLKVHIGGAKLSAQLNPLPKEAFKRKEVAHFVLHIDLTDVRVLIDRMTMSDLGQKDLGEFEMIDVEVRLGTMKLSLPLWIGVSDQQKPLVRFEQGIKAQTNQKDWAVSYNKLIFPEIKIKIGNRIIHPNLKLIDSKFRSLLQSSLIIRDIPETILNKMEQSIVGHINRLAHRLTSKIPDQWAELPTPGSTGQDQMLPNLKLGGRLSGITQHQGIWMRWDAYLEDPLMNQLAPDLRWRSRSAPLGRALPIHKYDVLLAIDRAFINRSLQLAFHINLMIKIKATRTKREIYLLEPFIVDGTALESTNGETWMKIKILARTKKGTITGIRSLFIEDQFSIQFNVIAQLQLTPEGLAINLGEIDLNSIMIDQNSFTFLGSLFKSRVVAGILKEFEYVNVEWKKSPEKFPAELPLPSSLVNLNLTTIHIHFEPSGHLVFYMKRQ